MTGALDSDNLTVAQALEYWLENRRADVKRSTWKSYYCAAAYVVGPLLEGKRGQRYNFTRSGRKPPDAKFVQMLGPTLVGELTVRRQVFCDRLRFSRREALARFGFQVRRLYADAAIVCV